MSREAGWSRAGASGARRLVRATLVIAGAAATVAASKQFLDPRSSIRDPHRWAWAGRAENRLQQTAQLTADMSDSLRLFYTGYAIGKETYELTREANGYRWSADFQYRDRGRRTHVAGSARLGSDFSPQQMEIRRFINDTSVRVSASVSVRRGNATVFANGQTTQVTLPAAAFAISGTSPVTQHLLLVRYWLARGRPATLSVVPGLPRNDVSISWRGRDTLSLNGKPVVLERYMVDGVVWGRESVWLDSAGRLAGFTTAGGGGLTLEAVRIELESLYPKLVALAMRDRLADLAELSKNIRPIAAGTVVLQGATLIDGTGRAAIADATIVVANGRITAAGPRASVTVPRGAQIVDVRGKTIAPGLWDMHAHLMQIEWMPVYLAAGVTTARDMGNQIDIIVPMRKFVNEGRGVGPHMVLAGLIDGGGPDAFGAVNAATPEEGRAVVRRYHDLGFEQVKLYSLLKPDVVAAIAQESHRLGMTVTGHVPSALTLLAAVDRGMDHIAHMPIRGEPGSDSVRSTIAALKAHGTVIDPTASWGELGSHSTAEPVSNFQPGFAYLPRALAQRIGAMGAAVDTATAHARMARTLSIIRMLYEAGVPVVAGTDEGVPGFSVYREVELYKMAGMSAIDAIRAASVVPAQAMRLDKEVGTLEPGKRADLIVLDANPLEDIRNISKVRFVMKSGTLYRTAELWNAAGFRAPGNGLTN